MEAIERENEERLAYLAALEAERRAEAQLEESGSVYTCGVNVQGQLGQCDVDPRRKFTVIRQLRGKGVRVHGVCERRVVRRSGRSRVADVTCCGVCPG